jgi:hypothetical protein
VAGPFASSRKVIAECDICGFRYKLRELKNIITRGRDTNIKACPDCFSPDHPQNKQGLYPVRDPQAVRDPRPDFVGYDQSRNYQWGWNPVGNGKNNYGLQPNNLEATSAIGTVTVTT